MIGLFECSLENRKTVVRIDGLNQGKWLSGSKLYTKVEGFQFGCMEGFNTKF